MAKLQIIILSLLPLCFGQFSIQGPSDGNRRAQGLKYSADKGVEYTDQAASLGTSGFTIQGASDGNSDFKIQGATDGNADFQIQGATDGNANFQIHGPTDGGSQAYIQNYDGGQEIISQNFQERAIEYKDPNSGHRVNWRSYNRPSSRGQQAQPQYTEPAPQPAPQRRPSHRQRGQAAAAQPQQAQSQPRYQQAPVANINYNPIEKAPPSIQEILQFQAQIPYVNIIPEHLRPTAALEQAKKFAEEYPKQILAQQPQLVIEEAPRNQYRSRPRQPLREQSREHSRERRQAPHYNQAQQQPQQQPGQQPYRRINQPPAEPLPNYSNNVPQPIQQILKYQANIPYDIIANQIHYSLDKPYVPEAVQAPQQQPQPADYRQPHNQPQAAGYRQTQGLSHYGNQQGGLGPRPVNEQQY